MSKRAAAVALATKGFRVFLLDINAKTPAIAVVTDKAISDPAAVHAMWSDPFGESRDNNIGVSTDELLVLDFDMKLGYAAMNADFERLHALYKFKHIVTTPSGGMHAYFRLPPNIRCASTSKKLGRTVDTRSWHGYVLGAGSDLEGNGYSWLVSVPDGFDEPGHVDDLACAPQSLIEANGAATEKAAPQVSIEWDQPAAISQAKEYLINHAPPANQGQGGDEITYKVACRVRDFGVSHERCYDLLLEHWNDRNQPPWGFEELETKVDNAYRYAKAQPHVPGSEYDPVDIGKPISEVEWPSPDLLHPFDIASLPKREWVVPGILAKTFLTGLVAPSGAGKTQWLAQLMLAIAASRHEIVSGASATQERIWCWNQEDDLTELKRRIAAACTYFEIKWENIANRLFLNSGAHRPLILVARDPHGKLKRTKYVKQVIKHLIDNQIGVLIIDPFVEFHEADENNNVEMRLVAAVLRQIAVEANCAVMFGHHTKKPDGASADGFAGNADSGRGASSLQGVTRVMLTLYAMTVKDAKAYGIKEDDRHLYVRLDGAKSNISASTSGNRPQWFRRVSVPLGEGGEEVGVLVPSELTKAESRVAKEKEEMGDSEQNKDCQAASVIADIMEDEGLDRAKWRDIRGKATKALGWSSTKMADWVTDVGGKMRTLKAEFGKTVEFKSAGNGSGYFVKLHVKQDGENVLD